MKSSSSGNKKSKTFQIPNLKFQWGHRPTAVCSADAPTKTLRWKRGADLVFGIWYLGFAGWYLPQTTYPIGITNANTTVVIIAVIPTIAASGVHDLSVSTSVNMPIFAIIQNPLSFIQEPTIEPLPIASAR